MMQETELRKRRKAIKGLTQAKLAKKSGTSQPQIRRLEAGQREMTGPWALKIAPHLENTIPEDLVFGALTVHIVGYVGAASEAHFHAEASGYFGLARRPRGGTKDTVAVEVRGDSLGSALDNWIIYYDDRRDPPTSDLLNKLCVVGLENGQVLVKRLIRGHAPGRFDLWPLAPGDPMVDQAVQWAARVIALTSPDQAKVEESQEEKPAPQTTRKQPRVAKRAKR